jgi:hypothetical protein
MKRYLLMHLGFERPSPEVMAAWQAWFQAVSARTTENVGLRNGREIARDGVRDLPMGLDAITGYTILSAESIEDAQRLAASNPFVSSIRIYELVAYQAA